MKILVFLLLAAPFLTAQEKATVERKPAAAAKPPADQVFVRRYEVLNNDPAGLIAEMIVKHTVHQSIPGRLGRSGGGGGRSFETTEWRASGIYVFIPHTKETSNITAGEKFTARAWIDGSTRRLDDGELYRVHRILNTVPK